MRIRVNKLTLRQLYFKCERQL